MHRTHLACLARSRLFTSMNHSPLPFHAPTLNCSLLRLASFQDTHLESLTLYLSLPVLLPPPPPTSLRSTGPTLSTWWTATWGCSPTRRPIYCGTRNLFPSTSLPPSSGQGLTDTRSSRTQTSLAPLPFAFTAPFHVRSCLILDILSHRGEGRGVLSMTVIPSDEN